MMAGIKAKDTKPERIVRSILHRIGFRFRLHRKDLPGKPDIVLPKWRVAILVHGCFWHGHENCPLFRLPKSRTDFWSKKIGQNKTRDAANLVKLRDAGWRVLEIWECALKGRTALEVEAVASALASFLAERTSYTEIRGDR